MRKVISLLIASLCMLALLPVAASAHTQENPFVTDLIAGRHMVIGTVKVWNTPSWLLVEFYSPGWWVCETHLYVGTNPPTKSAPGRFPYGGMHYYMVPHNATPDTTLYIAAHAVVEKCEEIGDSYVCQKETAWGWGTPFGNNWAMYFPYTVQ